MVQILTRQSKQFAWGMKVFVLSLTVSVATFAIEKNDVIEAVTNLKTACGTPDFTKAPNLYPHAAKFVVYMGHDKTRKHKVPADYSQEEDQRGVNSVCERINNKIGTIDAWGEMMTRTKRGQSWYAIEAQHAKKNRIKKNIFAFVEINGNCIWVISTRHRITE